MPEAENQQNAPSSPPDVTAVRRRPWWKRLLRIAAWSGATFIFLLLALVALTFIYQDNVKKYVVSEVNRRVNTTIIVAPQDIDLTIIRTFPDVSVEFSNISALDATKSKKRDTLFSAGKISLAFNILDLFHGNYSIHHITMEDATLHLRVDAHGHDNYHFLKADTSSAAKTDTSHVAFALNRIVLKNVHCIYTNEQQKNNYDVRFSKVRFTGDFGAEHYDFGTEAAFTINQLQTGTTAYFTGDEGSLDLAMNVDNHTGKYDIKTCSLHLSDLSLDITGNAKTAGKNYALDLAVKGKDIDLPAALSLLPASMHDEIGDYKSNGDFYLDADVKGLYGDSVLPEINAQFGIKPGATISRKGSAVALSDVALKGSYTNEKGKDGLHIPSFSATAAKSRFHGAFSIDNFKRPLYKLDIAGTIDLAEMQELLQLDTIEKVSGKMDVSFSGSGKPSGTVPTATDFRTFKTSGKVILSGISLKLKSAKETVDSINGKLSFDGNNVGISSFTARADGSDIVIDGNVRNLLGYIFTDDEVLDISGKLASKNLDMNRLLSDESSQSNSSDTAYRLELPDRLKLSLNTSVQHVLFRRFEATNVSGDVKMKNKRLTADPISFNSMDGSFSGSGMVDETENDSLLITCNADINNVSMYKLFWQMENFGQDSDTVITYNNVRGKLTSHVDFASLWGKDFSVNEKKIYTDADITIDKGELVGFEPLDALSRFIRLEDLRDIRFQTLSNHITIRNRTINIPKMEINSSAINISMSGTHNFDNIVDYHFIVDLDELRAKKAKSAKKENDEFGKEIDDGGHRTRLFITMKGYIGNPDMKYDAKGAVEQLKEDLHQEGQNLKQILHEEFGLFKTDKEKEERKNDRKKDDGDSKKFILLQNDNDSPADKKKKKKDDDLYDDSGDY